VEVGLDLRQGRRNGGLKQRIGRSGQGEHREGDAVVLPLGVIDDIVYT